ncbi:DsrC family protein [hydrothermal vent metagenome]|uniref:DsrC family protein n=1 Tax=hydrothermal vent metagenome TaxID=652676 RepID=A0A3B0RQ82_9ZZZZ
MGNEHWAIIHFIRDYLEEHLVAADARFAFAFLAEQQNLSKKEARRHFFALFPYGYVKQACKIAGLQQPRAWSTG